MKVFNKEQNILSFDNMKEVHSFSNFLSTRNKEICLRQITALLFAMENYHGDVLDLSIIFNAKYNKYLTLKSIFEETGEIDESNT